MTPLSDLRRIAEAVGPDGSPRFRLAFDPPTCRRLLDLIDALQGELDAKRLQAASDAIKLREIRLWHMAVTPTENGKCIAEGGECSLCGILDCPLDDPLHYHHDGCPSEYVAESPRPMPDPGARRPRPPTTRTMR